MVQIVTVNVSEVVAPAPSILQKTGALISQGATVTSPGTSSLLTQLSDLTPLLTGALSVTGITQSAGLATAVCASAHGFTIGDTLLITFAGAAVGAYNGPQLCTVTTTTHLTFAVPSGTTSPAGGTIVYTPEDVAELLQMATTFFSQGNATSVYVLELGAGNVADGTGFLGAWITANPSVFYSYLVPRTWDADPTFLTLLARFESTTAKTYFFVTTTLNTYQVYTALEKCVFSLIESPPLGQYPANILTAAAYTAGWGANALTAISWAVGGIVTATTTTNHGVLPGQTFSISGCTPAGYNGTFVALHGTATHSLVYALETNPGAESGLGTLVTSVGGTVTATTTTNHDVAVGEYFTIAGCVPTGYNGTFQALPGTATNSLVYAVPAALGAESHLGTLVASYYANVGVPSTEFSCAAPFWVTLHYAPSDINKVTPLCFAYVFGVTPFPTQGNSALLTQLKTANINIIGQGSEGGISNTMILWGTMLDGNPFNYWYSVDWNQINLDLDLAKAVINGSNNPVNPLYYNQPGINTLQKVAQGTMNRGITFGLNLGPITVNAVPFVTYVADNPSDYPNGIYNGLSATVTPSRGFESITFNLVVSSFVSP